MGYIKRFFKDLFVLVALFGIFVGIVFIVDLTQATKKSFNNIINQKDLKDNDIAEISFVSQTEYTSKDSNGSTIVKLRDSKNNFINTTCFEIILYPNRTVYYDWIEMNQDLIYGEYWINFEIPDTTGVYSQEVNCLFQNKNITSAKAFHISALGDRILNTTNNIKDSINMVLNALNCTQNDYSGACNLLNQINKSVSNITGLTQNTFFNVNMSLNSLINTVNSINQTTKIYYEISAPNCVVGSYWKFSANVTNEQAEPLPFLNCTLSTNLFGDQIVTYSKPLKMYYIQNLCIAPSQVVNWNFNCERI